MSTAPRKPVRKLAVGPTCIARKPKGPHHPESRIAKASAQVCAAVATLRETTDELNAAMAATSPSLADLRTICLAHLALSQVIPADTLTKGLLADLLEALPENARTRSAQGQLT